MRYTKNNHFNLFHMPTELKRHLEVVRHHFNQLEDDYCVKKIGFFGSVVHGTATRHSDVDVVVEFDEPIGFLKFIELEHFLSHLLKRKVDLVTKKALKPAVRKIILNDLVYA